MTGISSFCLSSDCITRFFLDRKIDSFCISDISRIRAPAGRHPRDLLPSCHTVIFFGVVMRDRYFSGTPKEQAAETRYLMVTLESTALGLRDLLVQAGSASEAILPLPLMIENGKVRGRLSLKYCAADAGFGTIGENTLLIHPVHGNRLVLAAVITENTIQSSPPPAPIMACTHCKRCIAACPAGAIREGTVDLTSCRTFTDYVPRLIHPLALRLIRGKRVARVITPVLNLIAPGFVHHIDVRATCTACVTACPYFHKVRQ